MKTPKLKKLVPMIDYILNIDELTTTEFCDIYNIPKPVFTGEIKSSADQFLQIDAIKHKMFVEYAKFLNMNINEDMFIGEKIIFPDFIKCTPKQAEILGLKKSFDDFGKDQFMMRLYHENYKAGDKIYNTYVTHFHLKKVYQLARFGLFYNEY
jgi:hypothetical protein